MAAVGFPYARKRSRGEEHCEFMPLSKRINNLHINVGHHHHHLHGENGHLSDDPPVAIAVSPAVPVYNPGVTASQSSYYFDNKLLYELHFERLQRLQRY